ncbi:hypothetical protein Vlu01_50400 [Micromonospora lutea]|uniref:Uncharacterized protein n=1 Tax=Micromonospora lutea TaxID=419825 RepID=A0ABQ4J2K0_9ACTN|nr:hypothetical protein Vlu01_50400 [Micromonospora lutea]
MLGFVEQRQPDVGEIRDVDGDPAIRRLRAGGLHEPVGYRGSEPAGSGAGDDDEDAEVAGAIR